jgi:predicted dithiol-disulfide oxidoreductase (DUF899 family)
MVGERNVPGYPRQWVALSADCSPVGSYSRGLDALWGTYQWLDRALKVHNKTGIWRRRRDEYEARPQTAGSCCHAGQSHA